MDKSVMEYKGYVASVEFDDSADVLHGRIANSGPYPIATFEATDPRELRRELERSVEEYLGWCEEDGVEPRKPVSGQLDVRLGSEVPCRSFVSRTRARSRDTRPFVTSSFLKAAGVVPTREQDDG